MGSLSDIRAQEGTGEQAGKQAPLGNRSRIYRSKQAVGRPKDLAHLPLIKQVLQIRKQVAQNSKP
jgi:hypothetical protein